MHSDVILVKEEPRGPSMIVQKALAIGDTLVNFDDVPELRNSGTKRIIIKGIRVIIPGLAAAPFNVGTVLAPLTELQKIFLNIYCENWIKGEAIPILEFNDVFIEGSGIPFRPGSIDLNNWENLDWSKTQIQYGQGQACAVACTLALTVLYVNVDNDGAEIIGPAK